jgi:hypothetical protein
MATPCRTPMCFCHTLIPIFPASSWLTLEPLYDVREKAELIISTQLEPPTGKAKLFIQILSREHLLTYLTPNSCPSPPPSHGCMARGDHGLTKVSPAPAMPYRSMPCGQATPETALQPFQGWPAHRAGGLLPSSTPLDTSRRTPMP